MLTKSTWHDPLLVLKGSRAADLMTPCPLSIWTGASAHEALRLLTDRSCAAAPVVDECGRPVGVVSRTDLLDPDFRQHAALVPSYYTHPSPERAAESVALGDQLARMGNQTVASKMVPVVFSVPFDASAEQVVEKLLTWRLVYLLVTDRDGCLIGVVSTFDLLGHLHRCTAEEVPSCFPELDAE